MSAKHFQGGDVKTFPGGGTYVPHHKGFTEKKTITRMAAPEQVVISLHQHTGAPCEPLVKVGDRVEIGQKIGEADAYVTAPVHASVSGTVSAIEPRLTHAGEQVQSVVITADEDQGEFEPAEIRDPAQMSAEELKECIKEAGLTGMGGGAFPTYVNINTKEPVDSLILNGAECEPYLTCDHRVMVERVDELVGGAEILMRCIGATKCYIGIETNKPDAIEALSKKTKGKEGFEVVPLDVKYPQGYKSYLIKAVTGRDVPRGARSAALGCIVRNVGTTIAAYEAVVYGKPLIERVITVSGPDVPNSGNYLVRIGTLASHILKEAGLEDLSGGKVIFGGPMTGLAKPTADVPVIKATTGVLFFPPDLVREDFPYTDCVRCGLCVQHCPNWLYPNQLSILAEHGLLDNIEAEWDLWDCIECGICAYMCPANRPIVHFVKRAKAIVDNK